MPRYILIDNCSGYIWGDSADLNGAIFEGTPLEYAAALDASLGELGRTYKEISKYELPSYADGSRVYRADVHGSDAVAVVWDDQDQDTVYSAIKDCEYVTTILIGREND